MSLFFIRCMMQYAILLIFYFETAIGGCAITPDANGNVVIPASQAIIADNAFQFCSSLKSVTFPSNSLLETIGQGSFGSTALTAITVSSTVKLIGTQAFRDCSKLATIISQ